MRTGSSLREEITKNVRVVGNDECLKTEFVGEDLEASNDGKRIRLPILPNNAELKLNDVLFFRGLGDHEALHSLHTPFTEWKKIGKYCKDVGDPGGISMQVLNAVEDVRIERLGIQSHPGIKDNLQVVIDRLIEYQGRNVNPDDHPIFSMSAAITWEGRQANGIHIELPQKLADKRDKFSDWDFKPLYSSDDFIDQVKVVAEFMATKLDIHTLVDYLNGVSLEESAKNKKLKAVAEAGSEDIDDQGKFLPSDGRKCFDSFGMSTFPYFVPDDSIQHLKPARHSDKLVIEPHLEQYGSQFLRALKSYQDKLRASTRRSGHIDHRKLVSAYQLEDKVWLRKGAKTRGYDTTVGLLVDHSSSMGADIHQVMQLSASIAVALKSVNIPFELTGFATEGRIQSVVTSYHMRNLAMRVICYKSFNDELDLNKLNSCGLYCCGYTPDSEALELAVNRISERLEGRKILVILTDGESACGFGSIKVQGKRIPVRDVFNNHKRTILNQAKELGIEVYAIGVGPRLSMALYDQDKVLKVDSVDDLNHSMFEVFLNAIRKSDLAVKR